MKTKLSPEDIQSSIVDEEYLYPTLKSSHTICVLKLKNGFTVTGESAPVDPANYNKDIGDRISRENAVNKVWMLEGYALRERLSA